MTDPTAPVRIVWEADDLTVTWDADGNHVSAWGHTVTRDKVAALSAALDWASRHTHPDQPADIEPGVDLFDDPLDPPNPYARPTQQTTFYGA